MCKRHRRTCLGPGSRVSTLLFSACSLDTSASPSAGDTSPIVRGEVACRDLAGRMVPGGKIDTATYVKTGDPTVDRPRRRAPDEASEQIQARDPVARRDADCAAVNQLKVMSLDDRLVGPDGKPIASIPHLGIDGAKIGYQVGEAIAAETAARGWNLAETNFLRVTYDSLQTARNRTDGARDALLRAGAEPARIFDAPMQTTDTEGGFNAANPVLTRQSNATRWAILGMNDDTVLGAVRASEGHDRDAASVIAVGINGMASA